MNKKRLEVFFEFLIFGILMGVLEDVIAINLSTDAEITFQVLIIVTLVAIPFAIIGELIVDKKEMFVRAKKKILKPILKHEGRKKS